MAQRRLSQKHSVVIARLRSHTMVPATEVSATRVALHMMPGLPLRWHHNMMSATKVARLSQLIKRQSQMRYNTSPSMIHSVLLKRSRPYMELGFQP